MWRDFSICLAAGVCLPFPRIPHSRADLPLPHVPHSADLPLPCLPHSTDLPLPHVPTQPTSHSLTSPAQRTPTRPPPERAHACKSNSFFLQSGNTATLKQNEPYGYKKKLLKNALLHFEKASTFRIVSRPFSDSPASGSSVRFQKRHNKVIEKVFRKD